MPVARPRTHVLAVHPAVARLFGALDQAAIQWCLLRGVDELARADGDVDVLVAADRVDDLDVVAATAGFVRLPAFGHASHRFFITYQAESWVKADLVSAVAFGRFQELRTDVAAQLLERSIRRGSLAILCPDDAYWHLLLHCLLDKGVVWPQRRAELASLALAAAPSGPLATAVETLHVPGLKAADLLAMTGAGRWEDLMQAAPRVRAAWAAIHSGRTRCVAAGNRVRRAASHRWPRPATGLTVELTGKSGAVLAMAERLTADCPAPTRTVSYDRQLRRNVARAVVGWLRGRLVVLTGAPAGRRGGGLAGWPRRNLVVAVPNMPAPSELEDVVGAVTSVVWSRWYGESPRVVDRPVPR